jgi:competence protein ComEC
LTSRPSLAAWLGSIPLVAWYFHILTPSSGPANVLAVPLCGLVLICNLASLLLGVWLPFVTVLFNEAGWLCMKLILITSQWSAHWPGAYFYVPMPGPFTIGLYYFALISLFTGWLLKGPRRVWKISALAALCLVWCGLWLHERPFTRLTILPLGEGYGAYLYSHHSFDDWLIDCGNERSVEMVTTPFLRAHGVNRLSHLVLTHGNTSYIGGATNILSEFRPRNVLLNPVLSRSPEYRHIAALVKTNLPAQPLLKPGDHLGLWTVLHPDPASPSSRAEDNAIVLLGDINGARVLLLSNLGRLGQITLLSRTNNLHADILVIGLSDESDANGQPFSESLLNVVQPRVIIIHSTTRHHANQQLADHLAQLHIPVFYMSDQAVTLTTRPNRWQLATTDGAIISTGEVP